MRTLAIMLSIAASVAAVDVHAQGWVQGQRPVDPRLRNYPTMSQKPAPAPVQDAAPNVTAAQVHSPRPQPVTGGPLQRPTYLQPPADAQVSSGPSALELMTQCFEGSISGRIVNPTCVGYLAGFVGALRIAGQVSPGFPICLPSASIDNEIIVADVSAYLEHNPDALQKSARSITFMVMGQKYPCKGD